MSAVLELAKRLIERPSITPEDAGCQQLLMNQLQAAGFRCESLRFGQVENLWATHGNDGPLLVFAGHTDVVPPGPREQWSNDPFSPVVKDGMLYGRGAADMKGGLAAMAVAAQRFTATYPRHSGRIGFLITSDEEGPSVDGTVKVVAELDRRGEKIQWCVVGEPSSLENFGDTLRNGRRGSLTGILKVQGIQGHVAYPERADNPIHRFAPVLSEFLKIQWEQDNPHFPPTSFQISNFNSGTGAGNVIPGDATVRFNFRYSTTFTAQDLKRRVQNLLDRHGLRYALDWYEMGEPFLTQPGLLSNAVSDSVRIITGVTPRLDTGGGTSDGRFIAPTGAEVIEFGPLNSTIHKIDECVSVNDLEKLVEIYQGIMQKLLID